jgi:hypothetical protein
MMIHLTFTHPFIIQDQTKVTLVYLLRYSFPVINNQGNMDAMAITSIANQQQERSKSIMLLLVVVEMCVGISSSVAAA